MTASSFLTVLVDAALRSLLVAAVVGLGLAALRARNVVAQKAAWALVLAAALAMPWAAQWASRAQWLPHVVAVHLPMLPAAAPAKSAVAPVRPTPVAAPVDLPRTTIARHTSLPAVDAHAFQINAGSVEHVPAPAPAATSPAPVVSKSPARRFARPSPAAIALLIYAAVCAVLLLRLLYGLCAAGCLWFGAAPLTWDVYIDADGLPIRASKRLAAPVTIGSGIVLPAGFEAWDGEKLRIVLAHEASHVRQGDFWLQLCASLYTAFFWFSPLGWWLKRKLGDLSETISDRAAVEHAASHASYAQVLLEFAALPQPIPMGVAMAHHGRLISRIERLLNESSFRQAFAGGRARIAAAILLAPAALFAATTLRVQAATQAPAARPTAPADAAPAAPPAAVVPDSSALAPVAPEAAQEPASATPAPPPASDVAPAVAPVPPPPAVTPDSSDVLTFGPGRNVLMIPDNRALAKMRLDMAQSAAGRARMMAVKGDMDAKFAAMRNMAVFKGGHAFGFGFGDDGNSYAYVTGTGEKSVHFSGNWYEASKEQIEKARKVAHGDFLWFERDGKSYVIDDPAALAQLKPMQDRMEALGQQQEALGRQQEELGKQQEELGHEMDQVKVPTPDMKKELEQLQAVQAKLAALQGKDASQEQLAEIQGQLADIQGRLGSLQGDMGSKMGDLGGKMGALGEQQGKLGEQQGRLGAEQGRIAREMDGKVLTIIDEYVKNGKARPVE